MVMVLTDAADDFAEMKFKHSCLKPYDVVPCNPKIL